MERKSIRVFQNVGFTIKCEVICLDMCTVYSETHQAGTGAGPSEGLYQ